LAQYHTRLLKTDIILLVGTAKSKKAVRNKAAQQAHHSLKSPVCSRVSITLPVTSLRRSREVPSVRERMAGGCLSNAAAAERKRQSANLLCARSVAYESELSSPEAARFSDS
jgi:hypothetical protein